MKARRVGERSWRRGERVTCGLRLRLKPLLTPEIAAEFERRCWRMLAGRDGKEGPKK